MDEKVVDKVEPVIGKQILVKAQSRDFKRAHMYVARASVERIM